jgi:hypothetical protein
MNWNRASRSAQPLLFAAALAWPAAVLAQQAPAAPKPAPKPQQAAAAPAAAPSPTSQATLLGQFGDWGAYTATPGGRKVCFALAKPTSSVDNPPNRRTATNIVYMFISSRPQDKVKDEVSILVTGYQLKTDGSITIGGAIFPTHAQNDNAWAKNVADEARIIDAMRKGSDVVVKGTTSRGTQTTDTFSLKGISQALDRVAQECK